MTNLNILERLRTKEELINYFKQLGKEITEEELDALKQSYGKMQESSGALTMQQLDDVAGDFIINPGQIPKVDYKVGVFLADLLFNFNSNGKNSFSFQYHEVYNESRNHMLEDSKFLPVIFTDKQRIICFPINSNEIPKMLNATEMKDSTKECIRVYLELFGAQYFMKSYTKAKHMLTEYDIDQVDNIDGLVKAGK